MKLSAEERASLTEALERLATETEIALDELDRDDVKGASIYELDGAVTDVFVMLNDEGLADRATFKQGENS